jgi:hypothetical protein
LVEPIMISSTNNEVQPPMLAVIAAVVLFLVGGIWFAFQGFFLLSLDIGSINAQGTILKTYPGKMGTSVTYSFAYDGEALVKNTFVNIAGSLKSGDRIAVLCNPATGQAYIKDIIVPNIILYWSCSVALFGVALVGFINKIYKRILLARRTA